MSDRETSGSEGRGEPDDRRGFLTSASTWFMAGGLAAGYGTCAAMGARYLYPAGRAHRAWLFVARTNEVARGESLAFRAPSGARIAIARQGAGEAAEDFVALSSTCPHLGCQVHWEAHNERFFCPCHNGVFDPGGSPVSGPPAEAKQSLPRYPLKVEAGSLFIEVPTERLGSGVARLEPASPHAPPHTIGGPGHDPCLDPGGRPGDGPLLARGAGAKPSGRARPEPGGTA